MADKSPEFASYQPATRGIPAGHVQIRAALAVDAETIAQISARRDGLDPETIRPFVRRDLEIVERGAERRICCVAVIDEAVVGFAKARWMDFATHRASRNAPSAW